MSRILPAVLVVAAFAPHALAAGPYDDMLKAVPPNANALLLVNVKAAFASPLAKAEDWSGDQVKRYQSGIGFVPADAEVVVIASDVNFSSGVRGSQLGQVKTRQPQTVADLARREGGTIGDIDGHLVALSPRDVYYTTLPGAEFAAVYPADRQATARWIRYAKTSKTIDMSPYLKQQAGGAGDAMVVIALDLTDVIEPSILKIALSISPSCVKNKVDKLDVLARIVAAVKGMTITVNATDKLTASVRIDFNNDPTLYKKSIHDLFLEMIEDQGLSIAGMDGWETTYTQSSMTLTGPLTTADLRRLVSLFAFPGTSGEDAKGENDAPTPGATKRYLDAVNVILTDVSNRKDSPDYTKTATWHDKAAEQIEHMSTRGVDPIAIQAGFESSKRLRAIAQSLRGVPMNQEALSKQAYYHSSSSVGASIGWGGIRPIWMNGGNVQTNYPEIRTKMAKVIADDQSKRSDAWAQISQFMSDARNTLQQKYKTPF